MVKYILSATLYLVVICNAVAQQKKSDDWFTQKPQQTIEITIQGTPPGPEEPGVPIDGGLIALIAAGGAMGYKKYKDKYVE